MDLLQGYGHEESPPRPPQDDNGMGVEKRRGDDVGPDIVPLSDISDSLSDSTSDSSSDEIYISILYVLPKFLWNHFSCL